MRTLGYAMRKRTAAKDRLNYASIPAPVGGLNTVSPGASMPSSDCVWAYNVIGGEFGLRSRLGYREYVTGIGEAIRSLICFSGATSTRVFAMTETGIWDVTDSTTTPSRSVTFGIQGPNSGWGSGATFVTTSGHYLVYTDESNGLYIYSESGGTWAKIAQGSGAGEIAGVDPAKFVHVCVWKNRLWFTERDTASAWYLDIYALYGTATRFSFGAQFRFGGELRGVWNWTQTAGIGIDNYLVALSGGGDVVIYQGSDPDSWDTFSIKGVWYVPGVPPGRRLATDYGGDLLVLSSAGIIELSKLTGGAEEVDRQQYSTFKVANTFGSMMAATGTQKGWGMVIHPSDACLMVLVPVQAGSPTKQLVMSLTTKGWSLYRDIPIGVAACAVGQSLFFGTEDGRICINDGDVDGVLLSDPNAYSAIDCSFCPAVKNLGNPRQKRIRSIAISVLSRGGSVAVNAEARYGYDFSEPATPSAYTGPTGSAWGTAIWGTSTWAGEYSPQRLIFGAAGIGAEMSVAVRFLATSRVTITDIGVGFDVGGML